MHPAEGRQVPLVPPTGPSCLDVVRLDGAWVGLWRPIVRTLLLVLVIPAVIFDADQRGLHDKLAGTVLIRA